MESLQDKIDKSLVESEFDKSDFLPQSSFDELITTASIDAGMRFAGLSPALANEISRSSRRLFAILAYMDMVNAIESLHQEGFTDQYLPVDLVSDGDSQEIISLPNDKHDKTIFLSFTQPPWNRTKRRDFYNKQWLVQSPVFATLGQEFNLNERCPLPFISVEDTKRGHFSRVYKVRVHHAHLQVFVPPVRETERYVAVKESNSDATDDLHNLRAIKDLPTLHFIKAIATCKRGQRYYFMFPWADGGNLREFWECEDPKPLKAELIRWVLQQILGLSQALKTLHNFNNHLFGRHGDLKPENILSFKDINGNDNKWGILQIADVGLAKFHDTVTSSRMNATGTMSGTRMYESPETEVDPRAPRSRKYDIWSMGCILLEFAIWLLYGMSEVSRFKSRRGGFGEVENYKFYVITETQHGMPSKVKINPEVRSWMDEIYQDPRCTDNTALRDLLTIIQNCLQIEAINRADSTSLYDELSKVVEHAKSNPLYLFNEAPPPPPPFSSLFRSA